MLRQHSNITEIPSASSQPASPVSRSHRQSGRTLLSRFHPLSSQEIRRRGWHFLPGVIAFILTTVPHRDPIRLIPMLILILTAIVIPFIIAVRYHHNYRRHQQESWKPILLGYAIPLGILALLLRGHPEVPLAVAAIIAFGDGTATLFGLLVQGPRVPWNPRKTIAGLVSFATFGTLMASLIYWLEATPVIPYSTVLMCVAPVACICAVIESLPSKINDNVTVSVSASILMVLMQSLIIGWP